jgi:phage tail protein X
MKRLFTAGLVLALALSVSLTSERAHAFTHVVVQGDTLASIAEKYYGKIQYEKFLVDANLLGLAGGSPIVKGMRLEVPAVGHRLVKHGETWDTLAAELLGAANRSDVLSIANGSSPWLAPEEGSELIVPYNLRVLVSGSNETLVTIAFKYYGDMNKAWVLDRYNGLNGHKVEPNDVVLVPLSDLPLSELGKKAAQESAGNTCSQALGSVRDAQRKVLQEIPALIADVKGGRYVDATSRGSRFLASGALTEHELAIVNRQLLEAYVALDATGLATQACSEWRKRDRQAVLDPVELSPKILAACARGGI